MIRLVLLTAFATAALSVLPVRADGPAISRVDFGFGGFYKAAAWTPLSVELSGLPDNRSALILETQTSDADGSDVLQSIPVAAEELSPSKAIGGVIESGRLGSDLTVRLRGEDGSLVVERRIRAGTFPDALPKGTRLWGMAGAFLDVNGTERTPTLPVPEGVVAAPVSEPLPSDARAYSAIDVLIVRGDFAPSDEQAEAIRRWVAGGGSLAVTLGKHTDAFRQGPLAGWVPIEVGSSTQLRDLSPLERFAGSDRHLPARASRRVRAAGLGTSAVVLVQGVDGPLIARSPYGFGMVTLFAIDIDDFPFSTWSGRPNLIGKALVIAEAATKSNPQVRVPGVTDIATQLARADDAFPSVTRLTVGQVLLLLLAYAVVIGPIDYLIVHRLFRRPALTWITLPLLVLAGGWWLHNASADANGRASQFNATTLLDVDGATSVVRGRTTVTLYASDSMKSDLAVTPADEVRNNDTTPHMGWYAAPEATFGGIYRDASGGLFRPGYVLASRQATAMAKAVPQLIWSSRKFVTTWQSQTGERLVEAELLSRGQGSLEGRVTHHFPGPLSKFVVVFGNRMFRNPYESEWHPGEALDLASPALERLELDAYLRRRVTTHIDRKPGDSGSEYLVTDSTYDAANKDLVEIIQTLTFFDASGGTQYTGLANDALSSHDLTHLVRLGRAVVLAQLDETVADVSATGSSTNSFSPARHTTFVRLVLPVAQGDVVASDLVDPGSEPSVEGAAREPSGD